jgi:inosine-uridine nucleoside N-ribohydrolase
MEGTLPVRRVARALELGVGLLVVAAACAAPPATPTPATAEPATTTIPVIVDTDVDISDIAALAVLLRDPQVDVRAIAIDGTGVAHCPGGLRVVAYVLDQVGSTGIPFGCGREEAGPDGTPFPDAWRAAADAGFGLDLPPAGDPGKPPTAVAVIKDAIQQSSSAPTILALGPWTNLEDAFAADGNLADRVAGILAMLGTIKAPGNVVVDGHTAADQLEWNAFADPSAVTAVLDTDVPVTLVPLDATDDVPVPSGLSQRLEDVHAAGADLVHELLVRNPARLDQNDEQLWDELAALALTNDDLLDWTDATVTVDPHGRLVEDDAGQAIRYATSANAAAVEAALLQALGRGAPRAKPFQLAGLLAVTFDGQRCTITGHSDREGPHVLRFKDPIRRRGGVAVVGTTAPHTWEDLLAALPDVNSRAAPPDWLAVGPMVEDAEGRGMVLTTSGNLGEGFYGPLCYVGTWPDVVLTPGTPFEVGSGKIGS